LRVQGDLINTNAVTPTSYSEEGLNWSTFLDNPTKQILF